MAGGIKQSAITMAMFCQNHRLLLFVLLADDNGLVTPIAEQCLVL